MHPYGFKKDLGTPFGVHGIRYRAVQYIAAFKVDDRYQVHEAMSHRHIGVSRPGEFHPQPLSELYVNVSAHTAPIIQPLVHIQVASERIRSESFEPVYRELFLLGSYAQLNACTFASTNASNTYSYDPI